MASRATPSISAVVAAYQSERWIAEALDSILGQTRPPDEVIVVDDGSTDGTAQELERYADRIRIIRRPNGGCPAAFNTAFQAARGDYVAMCGSDDIWEPRKLEWQEEALRSHPEVDVLFGHAHLFGHTEGEYGRPPGTGLLDSASFRDALYLENFVCAPSIVIRRRLFERVGPFVEDFCADDYDYWFRCLRAGARFYYEPRSLLRYRRHDSNLTRRRLWIEQCCYMVHLWHGDLIDNPRTVQKIQAADLFKIARLLADEERPHEARAAFVSSLRRWPMPRALAWALVLSAPESRRRTLAAQLVSIKRAMPSASIGRATT